MSQTHLWHFY